MPARFAGRVAVVFGGGLAEPLVTPGVAPIGYTVACTLAEQGASVAVVDVDADAAARTVRAVLDSGGAAHAERADVLAPDEVATAVASIVERHGGLDVVCNNVGSARLGDLDTLSLEQWRSAIALNLDSVFVTAQATLPHLLRRRGAMVNVSSLAAIRWTGYPYPAYGAAKAGVNQLTRALAAQYGDRGVRVNAVLAGLIDTPLVYRDLAGDAGPEQVRAERARRSPTGRSGTARDVADAVAFLASDEARYVNGAVLPVDGGLHVRVGQR